MTKNLPSRQYNVFNSAFEKKIAEYQKNLMKINALERPYGLVKEVLLKNGGTTFEKEIKNPPDCSSGVLVVHRPIWARALLAM